MNEPKINLSAKKILLSRLLTRSGDQAWDFAVPLALVTIFNTNLEKVALYYLLVRTAHVCMVAWVCALIDRWNRLSAIQLGIGAQTVSVILATLSLQMLQEGRQLTAAFGLLVLAGILGSLGASLTGVAVSQDWLPAAVRQEDLHRVNSRLKQIDLVTEVLVPVLVGLLLTLKIPTIPLAGLFVVAIWNFISFAPEYRLLKSVYLEQINLDQSGALSEAGERKVFFLRRIFTGWRAFFAEPAAIPMLANALLWLTILSPHGVLLAAILKNEWHMSESAIGIFRGLGALFGVLATVLFPLLRRRSLIGAARIFIVSEAACLLGAGLAFAAGHKASLFFLGFILLSRVGLYGFSLGETEIRQITIGQGVRGRVNGFAESLTTLATIGVYGAGIYFGDSQGFYVLIYGSIGAVTLGAAAFLAWSFQPFAKNWNSTYAKAEEVA